MRVVHPWNEDVTQNRQGRAAGRFAGGTAAPENPQNFPVLAS